MLEELIQYFVTDELRQKAAEFPGSEMGALDFGCLSLFESEHRRGGWLYGASFAGLKETCSLNELQLVSLQFSTPPEYISEDWVMFNNCPSAASYSLSAITPSFLRLRLY